MSDMSVYGVTFSLSAVASGTMPVLPFPLQKDVAGNPLRRTRFSSRLPSSGGFMPESPIPASRHN